MNPQEQSNPPEWDQEEPVLTKDEKNNLLRLIKSTNEADRNIGLMQAKEFNINGFEVLNSLLSIDFTIANISISGVTVGGNDNSTLGGEKLFLGLQTKVTVCKLEEIHEIFGFSVDNLRQLFDLMSKHF